MPLQDALSSVLSAIDPVAPSQRALQDASGRIAAETIRSVQAHPTMRIALRDGYMAVSQETIGATPYAPSYVTGPLRAVRAGEAMAEGCDAVLPPDAIIQSAACTEVLLSTFPGSGVRDPGEDLDVGGVIVSAGDQLRSAVRALLGLCGIENVLVRIPRLSIEGAGPVARMIADLASAVGASIVDSAEADATVCLCEPGYAASATSVKRFAAQGRLIAHGLAIRPAASTAIVMVPKKGGGARPVFIVPDRMEDALAAWHLVIARCLASLAAAAPSQPSEVLPLSSKIVSAPGWTELVLLRRTAAGHAMWEPIATGSVSWAACASADAYCLVAAEHEGFPVGTLLRGSFL